MCVGAGAGEKVYDALSQQPLFGCCPALVGTQQFPAFIVARALVALALAAILLGFSLQEIKIALPTAWLFQ